MSFIKLDRKIQDHWLWSDKPFDKARAWIDLILLADWNDREVLKGNAVVTRKRGEVHVSMLWLANRWGWSRDKVRRFMRLLQGEGMITLNATTNDTTITVENYCKYQDKPPTDDTTDKATDNTTDDTRASQRVSHIKEKKEKRRKERRERNIFIPPTIQAVEDYCFERQNGVDAERFVDFYEAKGWMVGKNKMKDWKAAVRTWERNRKDDKGFSSFLELEGEI